MQKFFNYTIIIFAYILCIFSLLAFIFIHLEIFKNKFQLDLNGLNYYFESLAKFKELFAGTITLIVAYYGIQRFQAAEIANKDKIKLDRFSDWKTITEIRMNEFKDVNKKFSREFSRIRYNFYNDLYSKNMSIKNKAELKLIYDKYFKNLTRFFEETTNDFIGMGGIYLNQEYTYFFDDFYFVFIGCLDNSYNEIYKDTKELYLSNLDAERIINTEMYYAAKTRHTGLV
jgi:hypothetical protein